MKIPPLQMSKARLSAYLDEIETDVPFISLRNGKRRLSCWRPWMMMI